MKFPRFFEALLPLVLLCSCTSYQGGLSGCSELNAVDDDASLLQVRLDSHEEHRVAAGAAPSPAGMPDEEGIDNMLHMFEGLAAAKSAVAHVDKKEKDKKRGHHSKAMPNEDGIDNMLKVVEGMANTQSGKKHTESHKDGIDNMLKVVEGMANTQSGKKHTESDKADSKKQHTESDKNSGKHSQPAENPMAGGSGALMVGALAGSLGGGLGGGAKSGAAANKANEGMIDGLLKVFEGMAGAKKSLMQTLMHTPSSGTSAPTWSFYSALIGMQNGLRTSTGAQPFGLVLLVVVLATVLYCFIVFLGRA